MATLVGVYRADAGFFPELGRSLGRLVGAHACWLSQLTHSPRSPQASWVTMAEGLAPEHTIELVYRNKRTPAQEAASAGKEPCVLIDDGGGHISMILDWNDLELAAGDVERFERILRSKLLMY